jgi:hypothetical protein
MSSKTYSSRHACINATQDGKQGAVWLRFVLRVEKCAVLLKRRKLVAAFIWGRHWQLEHRTSLLDELGHSVPQGFLLKLGWIRAGL